MDIRYKPDALYHAYKTVRLEDKLGEDMTDQKRRIDDKLPGQPLQWGEDAAQPVSLAAEDLALLEAADKHAESYDGDDRPCIQADVINAFCAGAAYQARQAEEKIASQSQATLPSIKTWQERRDDDIKFNGEASPDRFIYAAEEIAELRAALAVQSQATKVQAVPAGWISICDGEIALSLTGPQREALLTRNGAPIYLAPTAQEVTQQAEKAQVGCERDDGLLNVHAESETCEVCAPVTQQAAPDRRALLSAAINCGHSIDENKIVLHRDKRKEGNALRQLGDRLNEACAGLAPVTQQAAKAETAEQAEGEQANVLPPFAAPASQHEAIVSAIARGWWSVTPGKAPMDDELIHAIAREVGAVLASRFRAQANVLPPFAAPAGHVDAALTALLGRIDKAAEALCFEQYGSDSGEPTFDREAAIKEIIDLRADYEIARDEAMPEAVEQSSTAGAAKGGEDKPDSSDLAPTTSTVSAPDEIRNAVLEEAARLFDDNPHAEQFNCNIAESIRELKRTVSTAGAQNAEAIRNHAETKMDNQEPRVTEQAEEDIRIARHAVFNLKEFRAGRSTFPGEALAILEGALDRLADRQAAPVAPTPHIVRDWAEDANHENGNYLCKCSTCGNTFIGYKRRITCKACAAATTASASTDEQSNVPPPFAAPAQLDSTIAELAWALKAANLLLADTFISTGRAMSERAAKVSEQIESALAAADGVYAASRCRAQGGGTNDKGAAIATSEQKGPQA
jgi:hypothetical protein